MKPYYAYSFLAGMYIGGYTNLFSKLVISGLVIYIVNPENFNPKRFSPLYNSVYEKVSPYISKIYTFNDTTDYILTPVSISMKSPLPLLPLNPLSPLNPQSPITSSNSIEPIKLKIK
jgi:hypothetical protein